MKFEVELREAIINKTVCNNKEAFDFALNHGHLPVHAADVIKEMKRKKIINYHGHSPMISYKNIYRDKHLITFDIL